MARKSRIIDEIEPVLDQSTVNKKTYAAVYTRKSLEDDSSLEIQVAMLTDYVREAEDLTLYKVYSDNGFTGINFDRPAFKQMIEDMEAKKFSTIVVKDGSRLGRNYLEAGAYMETVFPAHGIRFISVNDHYDSADIRSKRDGISIPLKNIMNEQYSKDLSRKLTSAFRTKQMAGDFIGAHAPYGYKKDEKNCNKLIIDPETAPIVQRIFKRKMEGYSDGAIAKELNEEGILSPFAYRYSKGLVKAPKYKDMGWKKGTIPQLLANGMYQGHMMQGRHRQSLSRHETEHKTPENEWIVVKDTHEVIVSEEEFNTVQEIMKVRRKSYFENIEKADNQEKTVNILKGKIYCSDCGRAMMIGISRSKSATHFYYRCRLYNDSSGHQCLQKSVKQKDVENAVFETVKYHMYLYTNSNQLMQKLNESDKAQRESKRYREEATQIKKEKAHFVNMAAGLYADYEDKILNEEEYRYASEEYKVKIADLDSRLVAIEKLMLTYNNDFIGSTTWSENTYRFGKEEQLTEEMVSAFISRIDVSKDNCIAITMNCMDQLMAVVDLLKQRSEEVND